MAEGFRPGVENVDISEYKLNMSISTMGLSERAYNCLDRQGIRTIRQLTECSSADLSNIRNFGPNQVVEVEDALAEIGFELRK